MNVGCRWGECRVSQFFGSGLSSVEQAVFTALSRRGQTAALFRRTRDAPDVVRNDWASVNYVLFCRSRVTKGMARYRMAT